MRSGAMSAPKIVIPRTELIDALEARRPWAQKLDEKNLKNHAAAEQRALAQFQKRCREAQKWDYAALKQHNFEVEVPYRERPDCPNSVEVSLDNQLAALKLDQRKTITVSDSNENARIYWLLTHDERKKASVC